ncbi:Juvenile hormone acid O-methyltransferase [Formica fusca]
MNSAENYITGSNMQHRDTNDLIGEYSYELSLMNGKCLDIGCGPGQITKDILLPLLPDEATIVGADISQEMVNYARKNNADNHLSYIVLDIESLDLPKDQIEQYDNAVSFYCLHWCIDLRRAFENIYKLLRPEGKALVMFIAYHMGFEAYTRLKQNPRFQPYLQDAHRYLPYFQRIGCKDMRASLEEMLQDIGFKILHCSNREKNFRYSKQSLTNHVCAVNPFIKRFPDENIKNYFLEKLVNEIMGQQNGNVPLNINKQKDDIILKYYLLIAYVQKPST